MDKLVLGFRWPVRYNCLQDVNENCEVIMHIYFAPWIVFSKKKMLAPGLNVKNEIFNRVRMQVIWPCSPYNNALSVRFLKNVCQSLIYTVQVHGAWWKRTEYWGLHLHVPHPTNSSDFLGPCIVIVIHCWRNTDPIEN